MIDTLFKMHDSTITLTEGVEGQSFEMNKVTTIEENDVVFIAGGEMAEDNILRNSGGGAEGYGVLRGGAWNRSQSQLLGIGSCFNFKEGGTRHSRDVKDVKGCIKGWELASRPNAIHTAKRGGSGRELMGAGIGG